MGDPTVRVALIGLAGTIVAALATLVGVLLTRPARTPTPPPDDDGEALWKVRTRAAVEEYEDFRAWVVDTLVNRLDSLPVRFQRDPRRHLGEG